MPINWFPGHMARATREILGVKIVDLVIEVLDARAISLSSNSELISLFKKPIIKVALKADLADLKTISVSGILVGSLNDNRFKRIIINGIDKIFSNKIIKMHANGLKVPHFHILVVGLPNVGKSSLINFLSSKKQLVVENRPGVTRNNQLVQINDNYFLYDTPGVFVKKITRDVDGYKLALIGTIKKEVIPFDKTLAWGYDFLCQHYFCELKKHYQLCGRLSFTDFVNFIGTKNGFLLGNSVINTERSLQFLYKDFVDGKISRVNYEI